jgi:hypothetical protein
MWSDVPYRIRERAEAVHYDQHEQIPWTEADGSLLETTRRLAAGGSFDVVAAAGQAARFGFALAEAGLANGLVLFSPALNSIPEDVYVNISEMDDTLDPFLPVISAMQDADADPEHLREVFLQVTRDTAGPDLPPDQLELARAMYGDHANELFDDLRATMAAVDEGRSLPDPPGAERPWFDHLAELAVPLTAVVAVQGIPLGEAIARRVKDVEIVIASDAPGLAPVEERARSAAALLRMLDRVS